MARDKVLPPMSSNPLRAEFVLTGMAFLLAMFGLLEALDVDASGWLLSKDVKDLGLVSLGVLIATAYVIGIAIVQLTFFFPTQLLIARVRNRRFRDMCKLDQYFRQGG